MLAGAPFDLQSDAPAQSIDWVIQEMAKKELPALMKASELGAIKFVTSGIDEIDAATKGFPVGRVTEIYGMEGVGKTSLTLQAIAGMQKKKKKVLFIDVENALNIDRAKQFGVDLDKLSVSTAVVVEEIAEIVIGYLGQFDLIVVDSLAAMIPRAEYDGDPGEQHMGLKARAMGQFMRKVIKPLADAHCALVFINQQRMTLEPFGERKITPGGKAVPFATSLRLELKTAKSKDKIESTKGGVKHRAGHWVTATVTKSKVGAPYTEIRFKLLY